jgi:hypothetical protein
MQSPAPNCCFCLTGCSGCYSPAHGEAGGRHYSSFSPRRSFAGIATGSVGAGAAAQAVTAPVAAHSLTNFAPRSPRWRPPTRCGELRVSTANSASWARRIRRRRGLPQEVVEAFPEDTAPRWLLRDRDTIYDDAPGRRIASLGITEVVSSPRSPWQSPATIGAAPTLRWTRMLPTVGRVPEALAGSSRRRRSTGFITATIAKRRELHPRNDAAG